MVRSYQRKTNRGNCGSDNLKSALTSVQEGMTLSKASKIYGVPRKTIRRHAKKEVGTPGEVHLGRHRIILSDDVEKELFDHITYMEKALYGLGTKDVRRLAYEIAERTGISHPFSREKKMAGKEWLRGFLARYPSLSIREPQGTSLARVLGFTRSKVNEFFTICKDLLATTHATPSRIWNMDETGISVVHKPAKILATKGARQVSKVTSGERGKNITVVCAMNAAGIYLPPMIIFPRKRMVESLMNGAPPQSVGCASSSGWIDAELFLKWLNHFAIVTNASSNAPQIIILDGHHSHKTLEAVVFARAHGICLLTLPPKSTHKMQPLDTAYFKSFKSAYNAAADSWMISHPGQKLSAFEVAGVFGKAYLRSATPEKAIRGFACCGLCPYDENIFENDFENPEAQEELPLVAGNNGQQAAPVNNSSLNQSAEVAASTDMAQLQSHLSNDMGKTAEAADGTSLSMETSQTTQPHSDSIQHSTSQNSQASSSSQSREAATQADENTGKVKMITNKLRLPL